jgi:hypothetical protein
MSRNRTDSVLAVSENGTKTAFIKAAVTVGNKVNKNAIIIQPPLAFTPQLKEESKI